MIIDHIENACKYKYIDGKLSAALEFLQASARRHPEPGEHAITGKKVYAIVNHCMTRKRVAEKLETHCRYIDVHYMLEGRELIGYACAKHLNPEPYDAQRDVQLHTGRADYLMLREGMFAIMLPDDAHVPGIAVDMPLPVKKIVVKVAVE